MMAERGHAELPKPYLSEEPPKSGLSKVLGPTDGSQSGNVRAILSIVLAVGFVGFSFLALILYSRDAHNAFLQTLVHDLEIAFIASFSSVTAFYLAVRTVQTSRGG